MYSGSDSTESQNYPQWALNPSTYQNMANDQVDWAALAQQWIIMKEAGPPPMPDHSSSNKPKRPEILNEGGEAPMEVESERDENTTSPNWTTAPGDDWAWNAQNQNWGWNNAWTPPAGVPPPIPTVKPPLLPTPGNYNQFSTAPETNNDNATAFNSNASNNDYNTGYWTSSGNSKQVKPHNRRYSKVNVPRPVQPAVVTENQPSLDAAKRKQLPAWIREGLEKMERDKIKMIEREREKQEREEYNEIIKKNEKETMEILKSTIKEQQQQQKSRFDSDQEPSNDEPPQKPKIVKEEPLPLSAEDQMIKVRRTMTEILLKVTNREIENICHEELQRFYKKYKASDQRVSAPSGANVTAALGLSMYGGDSGSSSEESDDEVLQKDRRDSDAELKETIKKKKADFVKTEREIEEKLADVENKKATNSRSSTPDTNDNDTQVDAKLQGRKQRTSTSHSKSSNGSKRKSRSSSSSSNSSRKDNRTRVNHRSSTESSGSVKKSKKRQRSRSESRGRTPERKSKKNSSSRLNDSHSKRSKSPIKKRSRSRSRSRRESTGSKHRHSRRSRSYSRSRRSRSLSYSRRGRRSRSRRRRSNSKNRRTRSRSRSYGKVRRSRSRSSRRRSRSSSSGRGKRSHRR